MLIDYSIVYALCNIREVDRDNRLTFYRLISDRMHHEDIPKEMPNKICENVYNVLKLRSPFRHVNVVELIP